jgi:hypothetical protein
MDPSEQTSFAEFQLIRRSKATAEHESLTLKGSQSDID